MLLTLNSDIPGSYKRLCSSLKDVLKFIFDKCYRKIKRLNKLNKYCGNIQTILKKTARF